LVDAARSGSAAKYLERMGAKKAPNVRDAFGATPLMYSAAYGPLRDLQALLRAGAEVNAVTNDGSTALMWATADPAKTRLLLRAGAQVNARRKDGATALLSAAFRENSQVFRMLLQAAADRKAEMPLIPNTPIRANLATLAYSTNEETLRSLLAERPPLAALAAPGMSPFSGLFQDTGFSHRPRTLPGMARGVEALLSLGADPNADVRQLARTMPPLGLAASFSDPAAVGALLEAGADPNRVGTMNVSPLMMAVAAEDPSPEVVRLLLDASASIGARDRLGRTALDWALMQGESAISRLLVEHGGSRGSWAAPVVPLIETPRTVSDAVTSALSQLQKAGTRFSQQTGCISCHHQSLPSIAGTIATQHGVQSAAVLGRDARDATLRMWAPSREDFLMGNCSIFGFLGNVSYGLFSFAEARVAPNAVTDAAATCLASLQWPDGRWEGGDMRPPLAGKTPFLYTALAIRALRTYLPPGLRKNGEARIAQARAFLRSNQPADTQGHAFCLLGLVWSGAGGSDVRPQAHTLAALQNRDGGWSQKEGMPSDAYATGQALFALSTSGMRTADPVYQRGVQFLLRTQLSDGTWFVQSRTLGFQPYLETTFPHGRDQFISAAATAWAAIALAASL
jgi:ankyrin repeat protein